MLPRPDLLLVPTPVPEDEAVQRTEPVALRVALRAEAHRRHVLTGSEAVGRLSGDEKPWVRRRRPDLAAESRTVPRRQPCAAVSIPLLERRCELDLDERLAAEPP